MERVCPACNALIMVSDRCPHCRSLLADGGRVENFYGPYSPYGEQDMVSAGSSDTYCIHLLYCPHCNYDTHVGFILTDI